VLHPRGIPTITVNLITAAGFQSASTRFTQIPFPHPNLTGHQSQLAMVLKPTVSKQPRVVHLGLLISALAQKISEVLRFQR
jgi:hypothetical protein